MKRPTLGVNMIIRDEAENLPKSLAPVMSLCDEAVVVDTGSRDGSKALARSYGARVFDFPWRGDFAAARNQALCSARTDYVLWLDADNNIPPAGFEALREALPPVNGPPAVLMCAERVLPQGDLLWQKRVFPKSPGVLFRGTVHEQLTHPEWMAVRLVDAEITHWGYADPAEARRKGERNLRLLLEAPGTLEGDFYHLYQTGRTLMNLRRFAEARGFLQRAAQSQTANMSLWSHAVILLSECWKHLGDQARAEAALRSLAAMRPGYGPGRYFLGRLLYGTGKAAEAGPELAAALELGLADPGWGASPERLSFTCASLLGRILSESGDEAGAERAYRRALGFSPANPEPRVALAELALVAGRTVQARELLGKALELAPFHRKARHLARELSGGPA
ncbi:MAG: glycosyltransferase [Deltaproteobacteria bacterium]|jgi:tetratricopeptide (TPR) repeat protein|nr:glycosyltransferase [Deltaproteobacteria bacterium]